MLFFIEFETVVFVVNISNYYPNRLTSVSKVKKEELFAKLFFLLIHLLLQQLLFSLVEFCGWAVAV